MGIGDWRLETGDWGVESGGDGEEEILGLGVKICLNWSWAIQKTGRAPRARAKD